MTGREPGKQGRDLSLGRLALYSMGSAVLVLAAATALLNVLRPGPAVSLLIVAVGLVGAVAAMGVVSTRIVKNAAGGGGRREQGEYRDDSTD